jgi:hypothetical protein
MSDRTIYVALQCDGEHWKTALLLSKADALIAFNISGPERSSSSAELPSIQGRVECHEGTLSLSYTDKCIEHIICLPNATAHAIFRKALIDG